MLTIGIIIGSTRPNRVGDQVGAWVLEQANQHGGATYELIDLAEVNLPLLDEAVPPSMGKYSHDHTKAWAARIAALDGFVFVTPEYNHSTSGALKNALDFIYQEWNDKAAGFVGYGSAGGVRAVEHLRGIMAELQIADVRTAVQLMLATDFENYRVFKPGPHHVRTIGTMLDQLRTWAGALKTVREARGKQA